MTKTPLLLAVWSLIIASGAAVSRAQNAVQQVAPQIAPRVAPRNLPRATATPRDLVSPSNNENIDARLQPTAGVLLPGNYWDALRKPLRVGEIAPDFALPLARDSRWSSPTKPTIITTRKSSEKPNIEYSLPQNAMKNVSQKDAFKSEDARHVQLSQTIGSRNGVTIVVFWAFWCDTWKDVSGFLRRTKPKLQAARALPLCVVVDASQQPVARAAFSNGRIWYPVVIDAQSEIVAQWSVRRVPTIFVIDREARIRQVWEGLPGETALLRAIQTASTPTIYALPTASATISSATPTVTSSTR